MTDGHELVEKAETFPVRTILHPMVERMLEKDPTPEALEKILALQREWETNEAKRAFTRALVGLRKDLPMWIKRDQKVDFQASKGRVQYTHTSLAAAMEAVTPALTTHGFSLSWTPATNEKGVTVTAKLTHRDGHTEEATISAPADTSGHKSPAQSVASTITLLQRYTALSLLGIATADMEEDKPSESSSEPDAVDSARNMKAMAFITKNGKTKEEAEEHVKRSVQDWTTADLEALREWIKPKDK